MSRRREWITAIVVWVFVWAALAIPVGTYIVIHFILDDPEPAFALTPRATTTTPAADDAPTTTAIASATTAGAPAATSAADIDLDGRWTIGDGSAVGYRVVEVLFGQDTEGVGRTNAVTGELQISGTRVTSASFTVDMATVKSDESRRDNQFNGRLMNVSQFPTATFELTQPIELPPGAAEGQDIEVTGTGDLTLRGETRPVTLQLQARRTGEIIQVVGNTDIVFADFGIPRPDAPGITTQDHGLLEFDLRFTRG